MVSQGFPKSCDAQIGTRIRNRWILTTPLILMTMVDMMVDLVRKMGESFQKALANLKKYLGVRIPNAPRSLDNDCVRLKFQFKMLRKW